jgi:tetratricopeptide (TPR) repeat protein
MSLRIGRARQGRGQRSGLLSILLCGLVLVLNPAPAWGEPESPAREGNASLERSGVPANGPLSPSLGTLGSAWRLDFMRTYLPGYLFREDGSFCPYDEDETIDPETAAGVAAPPSDPPEEGGIDCDRHCRLGERSLAAGFLPEALAEYMTALEKGCPDPAQGCRPRVGMLKSNLAMGRFAEAKRQLLRLSEAREEGEARKLLVLVEGVLAACDEDFDRALDRFTQASGDWHLCSNLEGIVGYALFRCQRYEDARNVFRVAMHSPWDALRAFGILGLADCHLALGQWTEAEPLYESLAGTGSQLGRLGLAEFRVRQGKLKEARAELEELARSANQDYWKGVALVYLMSLRDDPEEWAASLSLAERAQALVLPEEWADRIRGITVRALQRGTADLWAQGSQDELLMLAEKWSLFQRALNRPTQLLIGRAFEAAGLYTSALEVYSRLSSDPEALFAGARLAWKCGRAEEAQRCLEAYLASGSPTLESDAKLLLACVYARRDRLDLAKECLRGIRQVRDPSLWLALGKVEASMGMLDLAIGHLQKALEEASIAETEQSHLLYTLGALNYRRGSYKEALRCFRMAKEGAGAGQGMLTEPMEILCLSRLEKQEAAREQLGKLAEGQETDLVEKILDAEDAVRALERKGYAF